MLLQLPLVESLGVTPFLAVKTVESLSQRCRGCYYSVVKGIRCVFIDTDLFKDFAKQKRIYSLQCACTQLLVSVQIEFSRHHHPELAQTITPSNHVRSPSFVRCSTCLINAQGMVHVSSEFRRPFAGPLLATFCAVRTHNKNPGRRSRCKAP